LAEKDPAQVQRTVLWAALMVSQLVYVGLLGLGIRVVPEPIDLPALPVALAAVAVATAVAAHWMWRRASGAGRPLHVPGPDDAQALTSYLLAWVFDESIAIHGLVLGLLGFAPSTWGPFSAAAVVLMLLHRPRSADA
jgi:hypothetical protein